MVGRAWLQEHEADGQLQKEMDDGAQRDSSFLFSLGPQSMKRCCPPLGSVFPPLSPRKETPLRHVQSFLGGSSSYQVNNQYSPSPKSDTASAKCPHETAGTSAATADRHSA